ncbi:MAG TPA: hypothetical protein PK537_06615 [Candidatus Limiplasma sp.]|nr:hypothetical protein [Candidatus Limiplasma sp.]
MKPLRSGHVVIVELIIVILFFSLSSVVIVRLFVAASQLSRQSTASTDLLLSCQNWADQLLAEDDYAAYLAANGWTADGDGLSLAVDGGTLKASAFAREEGSNGQLLSCELSACVDNEEVFALPVARYQTEGAP